MTNKDAYIRLKRVEVEGLIDVVDNKLILPIAIEAIGKQVPMKPEYEGDGYDDKGELYYDTAYCPRCRRSYEVGYEDGHPFCDECGQALDWEGEK